MKKRIILTAGGTGGHLFPAQALAEELKAHCDLLFVGGDLSKNRYFDKEVFLPRYHMFRLLDQGRF